MKKWIILLLFPVMLYAENWTYTNDWALVIITETILATNFWGHKEWCCAKIVKSNRVDIVGNTIRMNKIYGAKGDTIMVFRCPKSSIWNLTGNLYEYYER